jgi:MSHA pilin protein MshD
MSRPTDPGPRAAQRGVTLVELVLAIVIISIAVTGVLSAYVNMIARSADPLIDVQAVAIAEAYMDEIVSKPAAAASGAGSRASFATMADYDGLNEPPHDQFGAPIAVLAAYTVNVSVDSAANVQGVPMFAATVTVTRGSSSIALQSYRAD